MHETCLSATVSGASLIRSFELYLLTKITIRVSVWVGMNLGTVTKQNMYSKEIRVFAQKSQLSSIQEST